MTDCSVTEFTHAASFEYGNLLADLECHRVEADNGPFQDDDVREQDEPAPVLN